MRFLLVGFLVVLIISTLSAGEINLNSVYYGDPFNFKKPASIDMEAVINSHPLYQRLSSCSEKEPDFWIYLNQINQDIFDILDRISQEKGYDLILERDSIKNVPDITKEIISRLNK